MADTFHSDRSRVVVVGGGVAGLEFMLALAELAPGRAKIELVTPEDEFVYRASAVGEAFGAAHPFKLDLDRIVSRTSACHLHTRVVSVDHEQSVAFGASGELIPYDLLVVATGARGETTIHRALTFGGSLDGSKLRELLHELDTGAVTSVVFAVPNGLSWSLPLYELALMTAAHIAPVRRPETRLLLVTPEARPLELFGSSTSKSVARLLDRAGIESCCGHRIRETDGGEILLLPDGVPKAQRIVTVPRLVGPHPAGLPSHGDGFLPTDRFGLVAGTTNVYAVGDATAYPVKHGGIAVEQATAAAEAIAARIGAPVRPHPFHPVLRGMLLTGRAPQFMWTDLTDETGATSSIALHPLWWPPGKIAGGRLGTFLHDAGLHVPPPPAGPARVPDDLRTFRPAAT